MPEPPGSTPVEDVGVLGRVLALPLLPLVLAWDGLRALWTRGVRAVVRVARLVVGGLARPLRVLGVRLAVAARTCAHAVLVLLRGVLSAVREVLRRLLLPVRAGVRELLR